MGPWFAQVIANVLHHGKTRALVLDDAPPVMAKMLDARLNEVTVAGT